MQGCPSLEKGLKTYLSEHVVGGDPINSNKKEITQCPMENRIS